MTLCCYSVRIRSASMVARKGFLYSFSNICLFCLKFFRMGAKKDSFFFWIAVFFDRSFSERSRRFCSWVLLFECRSGVLFMRSGQHWFSLGQRVFGLNWIGDVLAEGSDLRCLVLIVLISLSLKWRSLTKISVAILFDENLIGTHKKLAHLPSIELNHIWRCHCSNVYHTRNLNRAAKLDLSELIFLNNLLVNYA